MDRDDVTFSACAADADVVLNAVPYSGDAWYQKGYAHFHLKDYMAAVRVPGLLRVSMHISDPSASKHVLY